MRADDDVHVALDQPVEDVALLAVGLEPAEHLDVDREGGEPLGEGLEVLLGQQRRGHQHRHLLAVHDGLERRPHRDLGLAVADVAADHPVHRVLALHVGLDLLDGRELVRGLGVREGVLELPLPRRVRAERVARCRRAGGVQADELRCDLADGLARPALALLPVGAAHLVQAGLLAADVAGDLVELVGRYVQPVAGVAALAGRVLQQEVLAGRPLHRALHHLDVPADAVLLVHHVVAGLELQRVDLVAAAARQPVRLPVGRPGAGQVGLGEHRELEPVGDEPAHQAAGGHVRHRGVRGAGEVELEPGRHVLAAQHLDQALGRPVPLGGEHHPPALAQPPADVVDRPLCLAPVRLDGARADHPGGLVRLGIGERLIGDERRDAPPGHTQLGGVRPDVGEGLVRRGAQVDRRLAPGGGGRPRGLEELLAGGDEVAGPGAYALRVADEHVGAGRKVVEQQRHPVDQYRRERLHALDRDPLGDLVQEVGELRVLLGEQARPLPYVGGQQQLAARRRPQPVGGDLEGALVGHLEVADLLDAVAPELDAQRVLLGGREDVEQPAADGVLTTLLDHVDAVVGDLGEAADDVVEVRLVTGPQGHRLEVAEPGHLRLQDAADRGNDHLQRPGRRVVRAGVAQPAQHGEAPAHGVGAWREPLVRQRLPGGVLGDGVRRQQRLQRGDEVLGLAAGRRHRQHRAAALGSDRRREERPQGGGGGQVEVRLAAEGVERSAHRRVGGEHVEKAGQRHKGSAPA